MSNNQQKKLKPCPFCTSTKLVVLSASDLSRIQGKQPKCCIVCKDCGARGPELDAPTVEHMANQNAALHAWNTRVEPRDDL